MNFLGVGSGLDLSTMLDNLVQVATAPKVQRLGRREAEIQDSLSGLGVLSSLMSKLQTASDALKDESLYTAKLPTVVQPSSGDIASVTAGSDAVDGAYSLLVNQLATGSQFQSSWKAEKFQSTFYADTSAALGKQGDLDFNVDGVSLGSISVVSGDSIDEIALKINGDAGKGYAGVAGVTASVVDGRLEYYADNGLEVLDVTTSDVSVASLANQSDVFYSSGSGITNDNSNLGGTGTMHFSVGGGASVDISVAPTDKLSDIIAKINDPSTGVSGLTAVFEGDGIRYYLDDPTQELALSASGTDAAFDALGLASLNAEESLMTSKSDSSRSMGINGNLTFSVGSDSFTIDVDTDIDGNAADITLQALAAKINAADDNFGVTATIVDGRLVYKSDKTGDGNDLVVSGDDASLDKLTTASGMAVSKSAADAIINVDGIEIRNSSNVFEGAVTGLDITASSVSAEAATITVGGNSTAIKAKVEGFISAYNELRSGMNELKGTLDEDGEFTPGKLTNNPIIRNVESVLNNIITQQVDTGDYFDTLNSIGLEIQSDGRLELNSDSFNDAVAAGEGVFSKLLASGNDGIADLMSDQIDNYVGFTGIIKGAEDSFNDRLDDLERQYEEHARYIESYQKTLTMQFTALDTTIAQMNATMSYVTSQLAGLKINS